MKRARPKRARAEKKQISRYEKPELKIVSEEELIAKMPKKRKEKVKKTKEKNKKRWLWLLVINPLIIFVPQKVLYLVLYIYHNLNFRQY